MVVLTVFYQSPNGEELDTKCLRIRYVDLDLVFPDEEP